MKREDGVLVSIKEEMQGVWERQFKYLISKIISMNIDIEAGGKRDVSRKTLREQRQRRQ